MSPEHHSEESPNRLPITVTQIEIPLRTIGRVLFIIGLLWLFGRLWSVLVLLIVAAFLAIALDPAVAWLQRRGLGRALGVGVVMLALLAAVAGLGMLLIPPVIEQGQEFADKLPEYTDRLQEYANTNQTIRDWVQRQSESGGSNPTRFVSGAMTVGMGIIAAIVALLMVTVLTIYLLLDGPRLFRWLLGIVSAEQRRKLERVQPEVVRVIGGYVRGQILTSVLFGIFTFVVLTAAGAPEPLLLAVVGALLDAIPLIGATAATIPAVLLAATVSITTAAVVLVVYLIYQQIENYVIAPRIYGRTMQISSLAALIAVLVGGTLLGILGVLLALPLAAALPTVVSVWREELQDLTAVGTSVSESHAE